MKTLAIFLLLTTAALAQTSGRQQIRQEWLQLQREANDIQRQQLYEQQEANSQAYQDSLRRQWNETRREMIQQTPKFLRGAAQGKVGDDGEDGDGNSD